VVARRSRQSTAVAVRANAYRHLHYSLHHLLPLHTPPHLQSPAPPPVTVTFPSPISIRLRHHSAHTSPRTASPHAPLPFLLRCLRVRLLGRPEIRCNPCKLLCCCRRRQQDLTGPRASSAWLGLSGASDDSGISAKRSEGGGGVGTAHDEEEDGVGGSLSREEMRQRCSGGYLGGDDTLLVRQRRKRGATTRSLQREMVVVVGTAWTGDGMEARPV
jgi:hypothetical protein